MAFGFLKKLVAAVTGRKSAEQKSGKGQQGGAQQQKKAVTVSTCLQKGGAAPFLDRAPRGPIPEGALLPGAEGAGRRQRRRLRILHALLEEVPGRRADR